MKGKLTIALLVAALLSIAAWSGYGQTGKQKTVTYEYAVIDDPTEVAGNRDVGVKKLNELGAQGWEIVGVTIRSPDSYTRLYLKRTIK